VPKIAYNVKLAGHTTGVLVLPKFPTIIIRKIFIYYKNNIYIMTRERIESAIGGVSREELIGLFADLEQTELPTRNELKTFKVEEIKRRRRIAMIAKNKKPSQRRGHNLNVRVTAADRLWKNTWMAQRGDILRHVGVQYEEEITALANCVECPQIVVDFFINKGGL
jgi:hypothetical protein